MGVDRIPAVGEVIAGKYLVERLLGAGGMGAVFEVSHRATGRRFAIKWLRPSLASHDDLVMRFIREAQAACRIDHPNVVQVYDVGQERDSCFMLMELLRGETLSVRLRRVGKLSVTEACQILVPVCQGVSAAHAVGVVHRDLKPDNIFLCRSNAGGELPKVLDFGVAKLPQQAEATTNTLTASGMIMGTPLYMAPEQLKARAVDGRTDVYALGVVLYEMLGGTVPFNANSYAELMVQVLTGQPQALRVLNPSLPDAVVRVVEAAMARDPHARFASADELARALTWCEASVAASETNSSALLDVNRMRAQGAGAVVQRLEPRVTPSGLIVRSSGEFAGVAQSLHGQDNLSATTPYVVEASRTAVAGSSSRSWWNATILVVAVIAIAVGVGTFQWVRGALDKQRHPTVHSLVTESAGRGEAPVAAAANGGEDAAHRGDEPWVPSDATPSGELDAKPMSAEHDKAVQSSAKRSDAGSQPAELDVGPARSARQSKKLQPGAGTRLDFNKRIPEQGDPADPQKVVPRTAPRKPRASAPPRPDL